MSTHSKNHYVPASYFKPWCAADARLVYFHWEGQRFIIDRQNPKFIAFKYHLYTLHGAPAEKKNFIEQKFFTPIIDEPGAKIQNVLLLKGANSLSLEQRHMWARYLLALFYRTPEIVEKAQKLGSESIRNELRKNPEAYNAIKPIGAPDTLEECISPWFLDNFGLVRVIPELIDKEDMRNEIVNMNWICCDFRACNLELLTCDRPLISHKSVHDNNFFLALPLSPKIGFFVLRSSKTWDKFLRLPLRELARKFNESIIANAVDYVYSSNDRARKFIQARLRQPD